MLRSLTLSRLVALIVIVSFVLFPSAAAPAAPAAPAATAPLLGAAASFSVLAALSMSAAGAGTTISGDLGLSPGLAASRTGPWTVGGSEYFGPLSLAATAQTDALAAYNNLAGQSSNGTWSASVWSPVPGVWTVAADTTFNGVIDLNGGSNDVWVFQVGRDMTFSGSIILTGNANSCNVFWQIGRDATIASGSAFVGTLIASRDISLVSHANVNGRVISLNSSLTTDGNTITTSICALATPSLTTEIHNASHTAVTSAPIGALVHDMATVTRTAGNPFPTGGVSFVVYANQTCSGVGTSAGTVTLDAAGVADPSNTATLTSAGLSYLAHYNGDTNYAAANGPCEVLTPGALATPSITTQVHDANHVAVTTAPIGTLVHDMATVTGVAGLPIPTGQVSFTVFADQNCSGVGTSLGTVTLDAAGIADPSNATAVTSAGLSYLAHYIGDINYAAADGPCEVLISGNPVGLNVPSITTEIHNASHTAVTSAPIGTLVHDMATVAGTSGTPTGGVSFVVYANQICSGVGTSAGLVTLDGAGVADPSDPATLTSDGLSYLAHYNGDTNYAAANGPCEVLTPGALAIPSITTQVHDASHAAVTSALIGTLVHDMATVIGVVGLPIPTGGVSFTVFVNKNCSGVGTSAGTVTLNAAGIADPSNPATVTSAGLSYLAHYNGDTNYAAANGPCEVLTSFPTAVELLYFRADRLNGQQVRLNWATALEVDNFGFNLYRAGVKDLEKASLIHFEPAVAQGSGSGTTYAYIDAARYDGTWWYWLADVDTHGRETFHAPVNAVVPPNIRSLDGVYFLPFIGRGVN